MDDEDRGASRHRTPTEWAAPASDSDRPVVTRPRAYLVEPAAVDAAVLSAEVLLERSSVDGRDDLPRAAPGATALLRALRANGVRSAAVAVHATLPATLAAAGLDELVDVAADGLRLGATGSAVQPPEVLRDALDRLAVPAGRAVLLAGGGGWMGAAAVLGFSCTIGAGRPARTEPRGGAADVERADVAVETLEDVQVATAVADEGLPTGPGRWVLHFRGEAPADEARREVLCTTGNGYVATRGAAPEHGAGDGHYPGTYLAGVYDRLRSEVDGRFLEHEELVNAPNWLPLTFRTERTGPWFGEPGWEVLSHDQWLDLRHGMLHRRTRVRDRRGRVTLLLQRRLVSMDDPHVAALETTLVAEGWSGSAEVRSGTDGEVRNAGVESYRMLADRHLSTTETRVVDHETHVLVAETRQSRIRIAVADRTRCRPLEAVVQATAEEGEGRIDHHFVVRLRAGEPCTVEKVVGLFTSRDRAISECSQAAVRAAAGAGSFDELASAHRAAWARLWARSEVWAGANDRMPMIANLHVLHLLQSVSPHTARVDAGVTARGLHGEAYRGHVFWDELFVLPLLSFRFPELARALLRYRYRRLAAARRLAAETGHKGAMFPWQSGSSGREETPKAFYNPRSGRWMPDNSHLQRHVGLAIAYNVWGYYQVTGDMEAMVDFGAELMIEIARFWADAATYDADDDRFDIGGVMGPDEFHDGPPGAAGAGLVDNAYTNVMVAWVLWRTLQLVALIDGRGGRRVRDRLDLRPEELARWEHVARRLRVPFDRAGRLAQFRGYDELEELDWEAYRSRYGDIGRLDLILEAEGDSPNRYKVAKQADVLMLFFMLSAEELGEVLGRLGYRFDPGTIPETIDYYLARTSNGSTLSRVVHAWVLARSDRKASWRVLLDALSSDIDDLQGGTTGEGIHLGAVAGTVDLLERCYVALDARDDVLHVNPRLPDELPRLHFGADYRGHRLDLDVTHRSVVVRARPGTAPPVRLAVRDHYFTLAGGGWRTIDLGGAPTAGPPDRCQAQVPGSQDGGGGR